MDYESMTNEELYNLAYIQEDPQAQAEYMRRVRLLRTKELLKREQESK
jgi:hypothetical protein